MLRAYELASKARDKSLRKNLVHFLNKSLKILQIPNKSHKSLKSQTNSTNQESSSSNIGDMIKAEIEEKEDEYSGELERLTDTTQTLIVEKKDDDARGGGGLRLPKW